MNPTFSVLHASYGRPAKAVLAMRQWFERATVPEGVEYVFALNDDDLAFHQYMELLSWMTQLAKRIIIITGRFKGSAPAWDAAAKASSGQILIQGQDDIEPPDGGWDSMLLEWLQGANTDLGRWRSVPTVVAVRDGYRKDGLLCTAICNRLRYEQQGHFLFPGYISVFSDDEFTIRAISDDSEGKCMLIKTDLVFWHHNPYHTGAPQDATLRRENSSEAYAHGQALFMKRNADLVAKGFKTW